MKFFGDLLAHCEITHAQFQVIPCPATCPTPDLGWFWVIQLQHGPPCKKAGRAGSPETCFGKIQYVPFIFKKN
jgi:hypothetical protein